MRVIAEVVYQDRKTLSTFAISFDCSNREAGKIKEEALSFAKRLRPKGHKILSVGISYFIEV